MVLVGVMGSDSMVLALVGGDAGIRDKWFKLPYWEWFGYEYGPKSELTQYPVFYQPVPVLSTNQERLFLMTGGSPEFSVYSGDGSLVAVARWQDEARPVTDQDIEQFRQLRLKGRPEIADPSEYRRALDAFVYSERYPIGSSIHVSPEGYVWIHGFHREWDKTSTWTVLSPSHQFLGTLEGPPLSEVFEVGDDYILGTLPDSLDADQVLVYTLRKREG